MKNSLVDRSSEVILTNMSGLNFRVIGPFLVADLTRNKKFFDQIEIAQHGMEKVKNGEKTQSHIHSFASFYKSENLDVEWNGERFVLPSLAITLVLPGIHHSWIPKRDEGFVGSADFRHEKQVMEAIPVLA